MSDPRRLVEDPNVSDATRELVGSVDVPAPLDESMRVSIGSRITRTLALPVAAGTFLSLKTAGAWGAILAGGTLAVSLVVVATSEKAPALAPAASSRSMEPVPPPAKPPAPRADPEPPAAAEELPNAKDPSPLPRSASRRDTLAQEESLLEQARRAIDSPSRALALLREHERRFPSGELTAERLYLTAQTHARAGNGTAARHYARLLADRFPKSTYVPRVRSLLEASKGN